MTTLPTALYRAAQVRELDRLIIQEHKVPGYTLMSRAGASAFAALRRQWPQAKRLVIVCGAGNNAGDGYVVARLAHEAGFAVQALTLSAPEKLHGDALTAYQAAQQAGVPLQDFRAEALTGAEVLVDAILGTGLEREISGAWRAAIMAMNAQPAGILALDIPSGLHADTGAILGVAVQADVTITFIGLKQGLFTGQGPSCCGQVLFDDLAAPAEIYSAIHPASQRYVGTDLAALLPRRARSAHKGHNGHVLVVGGEHGLSGAARMSAEAAARCGAGLTSIATRTEHAAIQAAVRPELMFHGVESVAELEPLLERATVVAIGPGLGRQRWGQALWERVLASELPLVVDADGLNLLAMRPAALLRDNWILTPHPGEAARLLKMTPAQVEADRFAAVSELALRFGGVSVLKGAGSLIASADDGITLCDAGNPGMASGGMGDVLTGIIAALLAQGLKPLAAARAGVYIHARAGDLAAQTGERGLLATDLLAHVRALVNPAA